jgi:hypothetical protein
LVRDLRLPLVVGGIGAHEHHARVGERTTPRDRAEKRAGSEKVRTYSSSFLRTQTRTCTFRRRDRSDDCLRARTARLGVDAGADIAPATCCWCRTALFPELSGWWQVFIPHGERPGWIRSWPCDPSSGQL